MILFILSYIGGALTIISPCILPVLPFVFARSDQPFARSGLPLLLGMAMTFAGVATIAAVGGGWAVHANEYGRTAAIVLLAILGVTLLFPALADRLTRPLVALGARLSQSAQTGTRPGATILPSFVLGIATGLLWAPCAGPILGLILTGAALNGASVQTSFLLLAYAAGAATSLAVALLIGGRVFAAMKRSLGVGEWVRRGLGVAVLAGVVAIAFGLDTGFLTQISLAGTSTFEQGLLDKFGGTAQTPNPNAQGSVVTNGGKMMAQEPAPPASDLPVEGGLPPLVGVVEWLNSPPLTVEGLRGKVVLVDFWTYSCINCLRTIPYIKAWADKYKDHGLVVIACTRPNSPSRRAPTTCAAPSKI
jgi:cytochrome c biogenesis protein CcdA